MPSLLLKPRVPPNSPLQFGPPAFVFFDTTLMTIIGGLDLIHKAGY